MIRWPWVEISNFWLARVIDWRGLRAWDAFPQTHHLESIAHFLPDQIS